MYDKSLGICIICATKTPNRICKPCLDNKFLKKDEVITENLIKGTLSEGSRAKLSSINIINDDITLYFTKGESVTLWRGELEFFLSYGYVMKFITTHNDHETRPYVVIKFVRISKMIKYLH